MNTVCHLLGSTKMCSFCVSYCSLVRGILDFASPVWNPYYDVLSTLDGNQEDSTPRSQVHVPKITSEH